MTTHTSPSKDSKIPPLDNHSVLLDTNILIAAASQKAQIYDQLADEYPHLTPYVLEGSLAELEKLSLQTTGKQRANIRLAIELVKRQHLNIAWQSDEHVDDALISLAKASNSIIATLDKELQRRARTHGITVLTLQNRQRLIPAWGGQRP